MKATRKENTPSFPKSEHCTPPNTHTHVINDSLDGRKLFPKSKIHESLMECCILYITILSIPHMIPYANLFELLNWKALLVKLTQFQHTFFYPSFLGKGNKNTGSIKFMLIIIIFHEKQAETSWISDEWSRINHIYLKISRVDLIYSKFFSIRCKIQKIFKCVFFPFCQS